MLHGLLTPVMLVLTIPGLRKAVVDMVRGHPEAAEQEQPRVELELVETPGRHRPESAPTRPSSVSLPGGMPGPDYTGRIPYRSNIRTGSLSPYNNIPNHKNAKFPFLKKAKHYQKHSFFLEWIKIVL